MTGSPHILVVDDEPEICEGLRDYFSDQGFRVSTANSSPAMRDILESGPVDLVILDLMMPGENGLAITQRRSSPTWPTLLCRSSDRSW